MTCTDEEFGKRRDGSRILLIAHSTNRWALDCLLTAARLEDLVQAPAHWQPGWEYTLLPPDQPGEPSRSED